jgi:uncharacterized membrane protein
MSYPRWDCQKITNLFNNLTPQIMQFYLVLLRILHIVSAVFWAGTILFFALYLFPAVVRSGPDGGKIMQAVTGTRKLPTVLTIMGLTTIISGLLLIWELSEGFTSSFFNSKYGIALSVGGTTAIIALLQGFLINKPGVEQMQAIGKTVAMRGGPPTQEELTEIGRIRNRVFLSTQWMAIWITISVVMMSVARYL